MDFDNTNGVLTHSSANDTIANFESVILTDHIDNVALDEARGLIATLGGNDDIAITAHFLGGNDFHWAFVSPGEGEDTIRFIVDEALDNGAPIVLIGGDPGDRIMVNGRDISSVIATANNFSSSATYME